MTKKEWNTNQKLLRTLFKKKETFADAKSLFFDHYQMVHESINSKDRIITFEDELWKDLDENAAKTITTKKGRTIIYGIWHATRIEDITMSLLVAEDQQVIDQESRMRKIESTIYDTGNQLSRDEILTFSKNISLSALREYRNAVATKTRKVVENMTFEDSKRKISQTGIQNISKLKAVSEHEDAIWLIDFWSKKDVQGILLMPCTRHNMVHINESMEAKSKIK